jgi:UDP-N-acetylmuramoyl-tripeptide--D-alanyl-D-alanine ligase
LVCISAAEYVKDLNGVSTGTNSSTVHLFDSKESAAELVSQMAEGDVVLVKASRAEKFEDLAEMITRLWSNREIEGED